MACLCIFMKEWVKEWFRHHVFLVEQPLSQASDWYKEGFKVGETCADFCYNMDFKSDVSFMSFQLFFIFIFWAFQKDIKQHKEMCWVFVTCQTQWLRMTSKNPENPNASCNRKTQTQEEAEVKPEAGMSSLDLRKPPRGCEDDPSFVTGAGGFFPSKWIARRCVPESQPGHWGNQFFQGVGETDFFQHIETSGAQKKIHQLEHQLHGRRIVLGFCSQVMSPEVRLG